LDPYLFLLLQVQTNIIRQVISTANTIIINMIIVLQLVGRIVTRAAAAAAECHALKRQLAHGDITPRLIPPVHATQIAATQIAATI
jgi:hypothetical protein